MRLFSCVRRWPVAIVLFGLAAGASAQQVLELSVGVHRIEAEVAATFESRVQGLMHRRSMPPQRGMLFVFTRADRHCMWMRDTLLPLSVAFLDADGRILNVEDMRPQTDDSHCAIAPATYALEMNRGWFSQNHVGKGAVISGLGPSTAR